MEAFSGPNEAFTMDSVGISEPISDMQDQKSLNIEDGVISSEEALLYWYESITMQYLGLQDIIDPIMINEEHNQEQVSAAFYGPSFGVDNGESAVYPETKSTVRVEREDNDLQNHTPGHGENHEVTIDKEKCMDKRLGSRGKGHTAHGKMKKRKTDQYVGQSVVETYFQKSRRDRCKSLQSSSACKSHEEKSDTKLDGDPPELPLNIAKAECQKDYIHLRARRGQATNSHSLAERVRREKISQRMKVLQELVPGCNKLTGKVLVLEEIINYVQSMQKQVEILSLKLECAVPLCNSELETNYGQPFT